MTFQIGNPSKLSHGHARRKQESGEYQSWLSMKHRCFNPKNQKFKYYGGRGITVCDRWKEDFSAFLSDVGRRPSPRHSLDRYPDRNGNYEPGNVRWATRDQQIENRDQTRWITLDGKRITIKAACLALGANRKIVMARIDRGWDVKTALETAPRFRRSYKPRRKRA